MSRSFLRPLLLATVSGGVWAQSAGSKLEFEVASVKLAPAPDPAEKWHTSGCQGGPGTTDLGLFRCQNSSLMDLITWAYSVEYFSVAAPDWVQSTMLDISAKVPPGTTREQFAVMLQNLLIERFKLAVHRESKVISKYDLVVAKNGPRFKEVAEDTEPTNANGPLSPPSIDKLGFPVMGPGHPGMMMTKGRAGVYWHKITMEWLVGMLESQLREPVADATGLKGEYEIRLYWISDERALAGDDGPTLMSALQDQLGLRLEAKKGPADTLVVDHAEKAPTEN